MLYIYIDIHIYIYINNIKVEKKKRERREIRKNQTQKIILSLVLNSFELKIDLTAKLQHHIKQEFK